jgi:threonine dehydrogenase-like Zn-dependent dehydrogenase
MQYDGDVPEPKYPIILGHEVVGRIAQIGPRAEQRWGLHEGDRVVVEPNLPCGNCRNCIRSLPMACLDTSIPGTRVYSQLPLSVPPGVWGGYADYMYLHGTSRLHKLADEVPLATAVLFNPLANGMQWAVKSAGMRVGDTAVVLGPGQRGLACVLALREAGASTVIITGLTRDRHQLDLAAQLGADHVIDVETQDLSETVAEITGGTGVDIVVNTTSHAPQTVSHAIELARIGGTVVLAGSTGFQPVPDFVADKVMVKQLRLQGVLSSDYDAFEQAVSLITAAKYPLDLMHTHSFGLEQSEEAILTLAGRVGEGAISVGITPGASG